MNTLLKFLFPLKPNDSVVSIYLLCLRIFLGVLLLTHGFQKLGNYDALSSGFPDPLGVGSKFSLILAIFAEVVCSLGFIFGALYRLALIPMIFTMMMAFFVIHSGDPFAAKELPFVYMILFIAMYITGPGKYALDHFIAESVSNRNSYQYKESYDN